LSVPVLDWLLTVQGKFGLYDMYQGKKQEQ